MTRTLRSPRTTLSFETVDAIFETARTQEEYILQLHNAVVPDFILVEKLPGFVVCSEAMWHHICEKAMAWDREHSANTLPGGAWLNYGFSADENLKTHTILLPKSIQYKESASVD